jgi:hypothetical protein
LLPGAIKSRQLGLSKLSVRLIKERKLTDMRASALICTAVLLPGFNGGLHAVILTSPTVTNSATPFNASFAASNTVDGSQAEYASQGQGANTFIEYAFGSPQTFNRIVVINRDSAGQSDYIGDFTLTMNGGPTTASVVRTPARGASLIHSLGGSFTATTVRLDVDTVGIGDTFNNTGAMEVIFARSPAGMNPVSGISIFGSATAFNADFAATQVLDGVVGRSSGVGLKPEYASASLGTGTFLDFDLGVITPLGGFDWFDRPATPDRVTGFDMIFSQDSVFGNGDDILRSYTNAVNSMALGDEFASISARYVRFDVTAISGAANANTGMSEIVFYQIPEPGTALLAGAGLGALLLRRRGR